MRHLNQTNRGFTIIELLVVCAIISVLVAISLMILGLNPTRAANEAAALGAVRSLVTAERAFFITQGRCYYGGLDDLNTARLIDTALASGQRHGYNFVVSGDRETFTIAANPASDRTGRRSFFADESGIIRGRVGSGAGVTDPPIGE